MSPDERGFTIVEVMISVAIIMLATFTGLAACRAVVAVTAVTYSAGSGAAAIDTQATRLRDDAGSAFAVFVPATDMNGAPNAGANGAHEVDYYARADAGRDLLWRYFYDAASHTLQRYDYDAGGASGVRDPATGRIDPAATYPRVEALTAFSVRAIPADRLGDPRVNVYGGIGALFAHVPHALGVSFDRPGLDIGAVAGGNTVVQVSLANANGARVVHLAAGSMPTGFTITGLPRWHAIVYRVDQTHRFLFGFAGKSHVFINARIDVSYDDWKTRATWCDFNLLGNPDGLDPHDPHADYAPAERVEQAEALLAQCRALHPAPPARNAPGNPPEPGGGSETLAGPPPPSCWSHPGPAGRCWPAAAPIDWTPPLPVPADTPPPAWCATHAESVACPAPAAAVPVPG